MCDKELLIDYLYGELATREREAFDRHLASCPDCRDEVAGLRATRTTLESWAPPQPDLGLQVVRGPQRIGGGARRWWGMSPAWGLAAAALLVGAVSAAIARVEVTVGASGVTVRTGWTRSVVPAQSTLTGLVPAADVQRVEARVRELEARLAATPAAAVAAAPAALDVGRMSDAEIVRMVRRMIEQSEERQQGVLARQILQVNRDVELARRTDLDRFARGLEQIQRSNQDAFTNTKRLEDMLYRVTGLQR